MKKKLLYLILLFCGWFAIGQECPGFNSPLDGLINVPVTTAITWDAVVGVPGYIISIGTTPGGTEIVDQRSVGSATSYTPPLGLPEDTQLYVTLTLFFFDQPNITCPSETFRTENVITPPSCTPLNTPVDGAINVNIGTNIVWDYAPTATDYILSIGTISGAGDILNNQLVGNVLSYNPPVDFPANTQLFVTVIPTNENGAAALCTEESFTTGAVATLPGCATLISPLNGAINIPLTPFLEWTDVPGATGYRVTIGNSPFTAEILDNVTFTTNSTFVINFEPNRTFFVSITPFNAAGEAISCGQESFSTILGCGPFFDSSTGELVTLNPEINFPDVISFCQDEVPFTLSSTDMAEGYRWFKIDPFGNETLISETSEVAFTENGEYRYEAYNTATQAGGIIECPTSKIFNVVSSEIATISSVTISTQLGGLLITIEVQGIGDYEYAIDTIDGPYQDSNIFTNIPAGSHTVYVRDKNGCGVVEQRVEQDLTLEGFPKFFTPNGDGINDFWQFIPPPTSSENTLEVIHIFDRYGTLLAQVDPSSQGWDGNFNGRPLPSSDYWFKARDDSKNEIRGHFALKR